MILENRCGSQIQASILHSGEIFSGYKQFPSLGSSIYAAKPVYGSALESQLFEWHVSNLEYANGCNINSLSALFWDQDDTFVDSENCHLVLQNGNSILVEALARGLDIKYEHAVSHIVHSEDDGVQVHCKYGGERQVYHANTCVVTLPLGVLKSKSVTFEPSLPHKKLHAIEKLGFGVLNKIIMLFPYIFWDNSTDVIGCLYDLNESDFRVDQFFCYNRTFGQAVLIGLVTGESAVRLEKMSDEEAEISVMKDLRRIFRQEQVIPNPIQTICTRWGSGEQENTVSTNCFSIVIHSKMIEV